MQGKLGNNQPLDLLFFSAPVGLHPHRDGEKAIPFFSVHKEQALHFCEAVGSNLPALIFSNPIAEESQACRSLTLTCRAINTTKFSARSFGRRM